jgi:hypothetical protein
VEVDPLYTSGAGLGGVWPVMAGEAVTGVLLGIGGVGKSRVGWVLDTSPRVAGEELEEGSSRRRFLIKAGVCEVSCSSLVLVPFGISPISPCAPRAWCDMPRVSTVIP